MTDLAVFLLFRLKELVTFLEGLTPDQLESIPGFYSRLESSTVEISHLLLEIEEVFGALGSEPPSTPSKG